MVVASFIHSFIHAHPHILLLCWADSNASWVGGMSLAMICLGRCAQQVPVFFCFARVKQPQGQAGLVDGWNPSKTHTVHSLAHTFVCHERDWLCRSANNGERFALTWSFLNLHSIAVSTMAPLILLRLFFFFCKTESTALRLHLVKKKQLPNST